MNVSNKFCVVPPDAPVKFTVSTSPVIDVEISVPPATLKVSAVASATILPVSPVTLVNLFASIELPTIFQAVPSHCHVVPPTTCVSLTEGLFGKFIAICYSLCPGPTCI